MLSDLSETIYEAAFMPDRWSDVLAAMARNVGAVSGSVIAYSDPKLADFRSIAPKYRCTPNIRDRVEAFVNEAFHESSIVSTAQEYWQHGFVPSKPPHNADDVLLEALRRAGLQSQLFAAIPLPTGENAVFTLEWSVGVPQPDISTTATLNLTLPHLSRSMLIATRMAFEQAQNTVMTLQGLRIPACAITGIGKVLAANELFEQLNDTFLPVAYGGLAIANAEANAMLQDVIRAYRTGENAAVSSIAIPRSARHPAMVVHVLPLKRGARELLLNTDMVLAVTSLAPKTDAGLINTALFDLTPAESRLASHLAMGLSLQGAAEKSGVTYNTARTYLDRIYAKTGTHRQAELVSLLLSGREGDS